MDFTHALILVGAIVAGTELVKRLIKTFTGYDLDGATAQVAAIVVAIALMFLMRATVWADTQVIGEVSLEKLGTEDVIFAALLLGFASNLLDRGFKTVANIGENTADPPR